MLTDDKIFCKYVLKSFLHSAINKWDCKLHYNMITETQDKWGIEICFQRWYRLKAMSNKTSVKTTVSNICTKQNVERISYSDIIHSISQKCRKIRNERRKHKTWHLAKILQIIISYIMINLKKKNLSKITLNKYKMQKCNVISDA